MTDYTNAFGKPFVEVTVPPRPVLTFPIVLLDKNIIKDGGTLIYRVRTKTGNEIELYYDGRMDHRNAKNKWYIGQYPGELGSYLMTEQEIQLTVPYLGGC